jgi:hypothetical protein
MPTSSSSDSFAVRPADTWAEVRARGQVMRYRRAGAGAVVLVLCAAGAVDAVWPELLDLLPQHARLVVPELPAGIESVAGWLSDFIEGLGLVNASVLAAGACCLPALELAFLAADQVSRLLLVAAGRSGEAGLEGALATASMQPTMPLLLLGREQPAAAALPLALRFLSGEALAVRS